MLTRLSVTNFKSIGPAGLTLEPASLTVLVGPNGSGKSTSIEALGLLAQSIGQPGLQTSGDLVNFGGKLDPVIHRTETGRRLSIQVGMSLPNAESSREGVAEGEYLYTYTVIPAEEEYEQALAFVDPQRKTEDILVTAYRQRAGDTRFQHVIQYPVGGGASLYQRGGNDLPIVLNPRVFEPGNPLRQSSLPSEFIEQEYQKISLICDELALRLRHRVSFLSTLRGAVPETTNVGADPRWVGRNGEHVVHLLAVLFGRREHLQARDKIIRWAAEFGLLQLGAGYRGGQEIGADFADPELGTPIGLSLASQGSRQVLTIIVQLFAGQPGDIVLIEEPEISLHPEAQVKLMEMFADAVGAGKQIIITTHSPYLLLALTEAIQKGWIGAEKVAVYEITKSKETGSAAKRLRVTRNGVIQGWVSSFARVDARLMAGRKF